MRTKAAILAIGKARRDLLRDPALARELREQAGLSQGDVAMALGVTRGAICRWESGQRLPSGRLALDYLQFLREVSGSAQGGEP